MTRERIENEAYSRLDASENEWDAIFNSGYSRGFMSGACWRINSVWHDGKEQPSQDKDFIYETADGKFETDCIYNSERVNWNTYVNKLSGLVRWAYIEDLLPDGKEKRNERNTDKVR